MKKLYAIVDDDEYEAYKNGDAVSNNGWRSPDGTFRSNQPEFIEIDDEEDENYDEEEDENGGISLSLIIGGIATAFLLGTIAAPHIKHFWKDKIVPGTKKLFNKVKRKNKSEQNTDEPASEIANLNVIKPQEFADSAANALEQYISDRSSEEAQRHLLNITRLSILLAHEIRMLSIDCLKNGGVMPDQYIEWQEVMEKLASQRVTENINLILANNAYLLDDNTSGIFMDMLGCGYSEGQFIPLEIGALKNALNLKCIEIDSTDNSESVTQ